MTTTAGRTRTRARKTTLERLRRAIDQIDLEILRLLNRRAAAAIRIGEEKRSRGIPILDAGRERQILARVKGRNRGPLSGTDSAAIFRSIMAACRNLQQRTRR